MPAFSPKITSDVHSGRMLGKYEILCQLSTGGMSEIFLAFSRGLAGFRKLVVLKQILPDIMGEKEFVRMFLDEAKITAAFNHPNIAQVFDLDTQDGELFLAMEFVAGATLVDVARACYHNKEAIPLGFTLTAVRDTAVALHYAHTFTDPLGKLKRVIHRDIAEKNIMVTYEGVTKLLDFGIAKNLVTSDRTQVGTIKGTSGYMSPEQIRGEPLDARSDIFSLGVVLHECLTGVRLFHGRTPEEGMTAALRMDVRPPSDSNRHVPKALDAICMKALEKRREDRYETALEMARDIERATAPLMWHPEQSAEFMQRLFADRREETRELLATIQDDEPSGATMVARRLSDYRAGVIESPTPPPVPAGRTKTSEDLSSALKKSSEETTGTDTPALKPERPLEKANVGTRAERHREAMAAKPVRDSDLATPRRNRPAPLPLPEPEPKSVTRTIDDEDLLPDENDEPPTRLEALDELRARHGASASLVDEPEDRPYRRSSSVKVAVMTALGMTALFVSIGVGRYWSAASIGPKEAAPVQVAAPVKQGSTPTDPPIIQPPPAAGVQREGAAAANTPIVAPSIIQPASTTAAQEPAPAPAPTPAAAPPPAKTPAPAPSRSASASKPSRAARAKPEPAPRPSGPGRLSLVTDPGTEIRLKAQRLGSSPLTGVPLPPGEHQLRLLGKDGRTRRLSVTVAAGEMTSIQVALDALELE